MNNLFTNDKVNLEILRERSVGRWRSMEEGIIPLTAAESDFACAPEIGQAMIEYINGGYFSYALMEPIPGLKESMVKGLAKRKNTHVPLSCIAPIDSCAGAMLAISLSLLTEGDEAIIFDPVDLLFGISVRRAGATPVYFPAIYKDGAWDFSELESYITPKTKMICLCNPHNPMGLLYTADELRQIAEVADKHGLWIMNDEVWSDIVYSEKEFVSINSLGAELNKKTITCYAISKGFGAPGLRAGIYYALNQEAFDAITMTARGAFGGVDVVTQVAMKAAFDKAFGWVDAYVAHLQSNRDYVYERLSNMPLIKASLQQATFVTFFDVTETGLSSQEFVDYMLAEQKVGLVPGTEYWFGPRADGYVRLCYSTSREILKEGLDRIEAGINKLATKEK